MLKISSRRFDTQFLVEATGGRAVGEPAGERVLTDSRGDLEGALFVALPGLRFDGHDFVADVLSRGAAGAVVASPWWESHRGASRVLVVPDTLRALQDLARAHRRRFAGPLVAVTGSNGKTTTKELLAAALSPLGPVHKTQGNLNNHVGLPLTLLGLGPEHRAAVAEIGLNHPGELELLSRIASPRVAVITNVAAAHLEGLSSIDGVARAKAEIVAGLERDGCLVLPHGVEPLERALSGFRGPRRTFGLGVEADVHPAGMTPRGLSGWEVVTADGTRIALALPGRAAVRNLMAALAVGEVLGVEAPAARAALEAVRPVSGRLRPRRTARGVVVIDDAYNANPASLAAALEVLRDAPAPARHAILGDMLELGDDAAALHRDAGTGAAFLDTLVTVGDLAAQIARGAVRAGLPEARVQAAPDGAAAAAALLPRLGPEDVVLVKGSRGMRLETAVAGLLERLGGEA